MVGRMALRRCPSNHILIGCTAGAPSVVRLSCCGSVDPSARPRCIFLSHGPLRLSLSLSLSHTHTHRFYTSLPNCFSTSVPLSSVSISVSIFCVCVFSLSLTSSWTVVCYSACVSITVYLRTRCCHLTYACVIKLNMLCCSIIFILIV